MMTLQHIKIVCHRYGIYLANYMLPDGSVVVAPTDYVPKAAYKCGPNKHKWLTWLIPDRVYYNRKAACGVHDWMYTYPANAGDDFKAAADDLFKINMDLQAKQQAKTTAGTYAALPFNNLYYYFVRWFGKGSFYSDKRR